MENKIIEKIHKEYKEDRKVIKILMNISLKEGFSIEDTEKLLKEFYFMNK